MLYIGSASKRLTPGMRLRLDAASVVDVLGADIRQGNRENTDYESSGQLALADFIARGELGRHLRRMRLRYARRREALLVCTCG